MTREATIAFCEARKILAYANQGGRGGCPSCDGYMPSIDPCSQVEFEVRNIQTKKFAEFMLKHSLDCEEFDRQIGSSFRKPIGRREDCWYGAWGDCPETLKVLEVIEKMLREKYPETKP